MSEKSKSSNEGRKESSKPSKSDTTFQTGHAVNKGNFTKVNATTKSTSGKS